MTRVSTILFAGKTLLSECDFFFEVLYQQHTCFIFRVPIQGETGEKRKIRHRCSLAIALYEEFWGLGIGTAMINYMTELAAQIGWHQVDLEVVAENEQAQALYRKCGFIETGRRHNALLFDDGIYHDEILMYKNLK